MRESIFLLCGAFPGMTPLYSWILEMTFASNWRGAGISPLGPDEGGPPVWLLSLDWQVI